MNNDKVWQKPKTDDVNHYGMCSANGATKADLPTDCPHGSDAMDYSTGTVYFYDGVSWIEA